MYVATESRFVEACQKLLQLLHIPGSKDSNVDPCDLLAQWLEDEENGPWLLILDNADDGDLILGNDKLQETKTDRLLATKPLIDYIPRLLDSSRQLLVTTRNKDVAMAASNGGSPVQVGPLSPEEALLLLQRKLQKQSRHFQQSCG